MAIGGATTQPGEDVSSALPVLETYELLDETA